MMKKIKLLVLFGIYVVCSVSFVRTGCWLPHAFGSHDYHYVQGIPDGALPETIRTLFYSYDYDIDVIHNDAYGWGLWFINNEGVWYSAGDWGNNEVTACPFNLYTEHVQIVAYDNDLGTSANEVTFAVFGAPWTTDTTKFDFDQKMTV